MKFIPSTRNAVSFGSSKLRGALHTSANFGVAANCHPFFANIFVRSACRGGKAASKFTELGDGRKSRALFAKPGRYTARIPILDESANHFDVEGIDALAKAMNESEGRIFQVAMKIWI